MPSPYAIQCSIGSSGGRFNIMCLVAAKLIGILSLLGNCVCLLYQAIYISIIYIGYFLPDDKCTNSLGWSLTCLLLSVFIQLHCSIIDLPKNLRSILKIESIT